MSSGPIHVCCVFHRIIATVTLDHTIATMIVDHIATTVTMDTILAFVITSAALQTPSIVMWPEHLQNCSVLKRVPLSKFEKVGRAVLQELCLSLKLGWTP
jgi:hypothetical protein